MKRCKHCGGDLIVKQTKRTPEKLKKFYYYTAYYFCPNCSKLYHNDKFKVINENYDLFSGNTFLGESVDIEIWTDGACIYNGRENARAAWAFVSGEYEKTGLVDGKQTNNRAEGQAILEALRWAVENGYHRIKIYTDSQISIYNLKKPVGKIKINIDIYEQIHNLIKKNNLIIVPEKVAGHSGIENNERVDKLANDLAEKIKDYN